MAKCDLCGESCPAHDLVTIRDCYQIAQVKDVCPKCEKWTNDELWKIRAENAPAMRRVLAVRVGAPAPKKSFWRRIFLLPIPRPGWGEY